MGLISRVSSRTYRNMFRQALGFSLSSLTLNRSVATVTHSGKGRGTNRGVTDRFVRTGAGFYFRNISGNRKKVWQTIHYSASLSGLKISTGRQEQLQKLQKLTLCSRKSKTLDMMINRYHRQQKWVANNPYLGYNRYSKVWYYPGRQEDDPDKYEPGYWNFGTAYMGKSDHSYDGDMAMHEAKANPSWRSHQFRKDPQMMQAVQLTMANDSL